MALHTEVVLDPRVWANLPIQVYLRDERFVLCGFFYKLRAGDCRARARKTLGSKSSVVLFLRAATQNS